MWLVDNSAHLSEDPCLQLCVYQCKVEGMGRGGLREDVGYLISFRLRFLQSVDEIEV